jgi:hypothetical protein
MREVLASFELAKLAYEKGFNHIKANCFGDNMCYQLPDGKLIFSHIANPVAGYVLAPTLSLLQQWLWKTYEIWVEITLWGDDIGFLCSIKQTDGKADNESTIVKLLKIVDIGLVCKEPEIALEKGLFEALKLINN